MLFSEGDTAAILVVGAAAGAYPNLIVSVSIREGVTDFVSRPITFGGSTGTTTFCCRFLAFSLFSLYDLAEIYPALNK